MTNHKKTHKILFMLIFVTALGIAGACIPNFSLSECFEERDCVNGFHCAQGTCQPNKTDGPKKEDPKKIPKLPAVPKLSCENNHQKQYALIHKPIRFAISHPHPWIATLDQNDHLYLLNKHRGVLQTLPNPLRASAQKTQLHRRVLFHPKKEILTLSATNAIYFYQLDKSSTALKQLAKMDTLSSLEASIAYHPDGEYIAYASSKTETRKPYSIKIKTLPQEILSKGVYEDSQLLEGFHSGIRRLAFHPSGKYLLALSKTNELKLWSIQKAANQKLSFKMVKSWQYKEVIHSVSFHPTKPIAAFVFGNDSKQGTLFYSLDKLTKINQFLGNTYTTLQTVFHPDGKFVLEVQRDTQGVNALYVWDSADLEKNDKNSQPIYTKNIGKLELEDGSFEPVTKQWMGVAKRKIFFWKITPQGIIRGDLHYASGEDLKLHPKWQIAARKFNLNDGFTLEFFSLQDHKPLAKIKLPGTFHSSRFSASGSYFLVHSTESGPLKIQHRLRLWHITCPVKSNCKVTPLNAWKVEPVPTSKYKNAISYSFSPDEKYLRLLEENDIRSWFFRKDSRGLLTSVVWHRVQFSKLTVDGKPLPKDIDGKYFSISRDGEFLSARFPKTEGNKKVSQFALWKLKATTENQLEVEPIEAFTMPDDTHGQLSFPWVGPEGRWLIFLKENAIFGRNTTHPHKEQKLYSFDVKSHRSVEERFLTTALAFHPKHEMMGTLTHNPQDEVRIQLWNLQKRSIQQTIKAGKGNQDALVSKLRFQTRPSDTLLLISNTESRSFTCIAP